MLAGARAIEKSILVSFLDITDRKQEESARRENLEIIRTTFNATSEVGEITITTGFTTFDEASCTSYLDRAPGDYVQLTVSDTGCGMDKETASHIFEPFFTTKGLGRETGLGLSAIYGIVKQNNGFIMLYNEPDTGSAFNIFIPHHAGDAVEEIARTKDRRHTVIRFSDAVLQYDIHAEPCRGMISSLPDCHVEGTVSSISENRSARQSP